MALPAAGTFYFIAGGETDRGDDGRMILPHLVRFRAFTLPEPYRAARPPADFDKPFVESETNAPRPWEFPIDVRQCLELVLDLARRLGKKVVVIDVNRPGDQTEVARRWADADPLYPLLVSALGDRLEGLSDFTPTAVRDFLRRG